MAKLDARQKALSFRQPPATARDFMAERIDPKDQACAREPIHIPGSIQPHGWLIALDPKTLAVVAASTNARDGLGLNWRPGEAAMMGAGLLAGGDILAQDVPRWLASGDPIYLRTLTVAGRAMNVFGHRSPQAAILEFEDVADDEAADLTRLYPKLRGFVETLAIADSLDSALRDTSRQIREITGYNRVLVYRFDQDGAGTTVAEDGDGVLPSYIDLRFPGSDIPAQARELYRLNRLRLIPDAFYEPVPVEPSTGPDGQPLDLSFAQLRSVSPVHVKYMRNMATLSSMSVSIVVDGRLWGLIACHHSKPLRVPAPVRAMCDLIGQILAGDVAARLRTAEAAERLALKGVETPLLAALARDSSFERGLMQNPELWLNLVGASGAALVSRDTVQSVGVAPAHDDIRAIVEHVAPRLSDNLYATNALCMEMPGAERFNDVASGVLALGVSELKSSYVLWFRPEVVRTVSWAGDPTKPLSVDPDGVERLHPRASFEIWKSQVHGLSEPWTAAQLASATSFRMALLNIVLRQAEERAELAADLEKSNRELEAFSYSVSHDLRAPFRHIVGFSELLQDREAALDETSRRYLDSIIDAALSAGRLVDDLLNFSRLGRARLLTGPVDMNKLVAEARHTLSTETRDRNVEWSVGRLPDASGDGSMLRQVWVNLIGNALKYSRGRDPVVITINGEVEGEALVYSVADNGAGFDMAYVAKLFGVFQRLHRVEEFEGTGIGLALCQRIVERHGGRIWADGAVGKGATLHFALPRKPATPARDTNNDG